MTIPVPTPTPTNRDDEQQNYSRTLFRGILREIKREKSNAFGADIEQLKFSIEPTSYHGKVRYEWYTISRNGKVSSENSKFGLLLKRLKEMKMYDSEGIRDDVFLNQEVEWELMEYPPEWSISGKCTDCGMQLNKLSDSRSHSIETKHRVREPGFILPKNPNVESESTINTKVETETPQLQKETVVTPTQVEVQQTIIDVVKSFGSTGTTMTNLINETCKLSGTDRQVAFRLFRELRGQGKVKELNGKITIVEESN